MKIYRTEMTLVGTVYVTAEDKQQALEIAEMFANDVFYFDGDSISNVSFHSRDLPEISLSPAFTGFGLCEGGEIELIGKLPERDDA